jgi:hypothetical protein
MPLCSICSHPQRRQIDRAIAHGERNIAQRFAISRAAISRHRRHITGMIVKAERIQEHSALSLVEAVRRVALDARRITAKAEANGKLATALRGLQVTTHILELIGRLSGELQNGAPIQAGFSVNSLSPEEQAILQNHRRVAAMTPDEREAHHTRLEAERTRIRAEIERYRNVQAKKLDSICGD